MACALTQGRAIDCRNSMGGIEQVLISEFSDITAYTEANGIITAMTQAAKSFYIYELEKENGSLIETHTGSLENGSNFYDSVLEFSTFNLSADESEELNLLDQNRLFVIVKDNNGIYWSMGASRGADKLGGTSVTGAAFGDMNGYTYSFTAKEPTRMFQVDSTTISGLTTSA